MNCRIPIIIVTLMVMATFTTRCIQYDNYDNTSSNTTMEMDLTTNTSLTENTSSDQTTSKKWEKSGICDYVIDGDTINVRGVGRIRLVGVDTPERGQPGYQEAKNFVNNLCSGKRVYLDVDDAKNYDKYGRVLAVVYVDDINVNAELLRRGYAEILYIPPSEFDPYSWI